MVYAEESSRLLLMLQAAYGEEESRKMHTLAIRRALKALYATPSDPDGSWPGSTMDKFIYIELRKLVQ